MSLSDKILQAMNTLIELQGDLQEKPSGKLGLVEIVDAQGNLLDTADNLFDAMDRAQLYSRTNRYIEVLLDGVPTATYINGEPQV